VKKLVLASGNAGKLREFGQLLAPFDFEVLPQSAFDVPEAEEPHVTFVENAIAKARHAARLTGLPALADDSGLCVAALGGAPGVFSARYGGEPKSDAKNNAKLLADPDRRCGPPCALRRGAGADAPRRRSAAHRSPRANGTARSSIRRAAQAASATTPTSSFPARASPWPNCRTRKRTAARIAARRWSSSSRGYAAGRDPDHSASGRMYRQRPPAVPGWSRHRRWRCTCIGPGA
jgi:hypothetical protein